VFVQEARDTDASVVNECLFCPRKMSRIGRKAKVNSLLLPTPFSVCPDLSASIVGYCSTTLTSDD
jgi:hypothetical protein